MEQDQIRNDTISWLNEKGFKNLPKLPLIEVREDLRSLSEIAGRCIVLIEQKILSIYPNKLTDSKNWLTKEGYVDYLTEKEKSIFGKEELVEQDEICFSWAHESFFALMWALEFVPQMNFPTKEVDTEPFIDYLPPNQPFKEFLQQAQVRERNEIIACLDKYYHLHWFCRVPERNAKKLKLSVVVERRKALEWLVNPALAWDEIPLNT